MSGEDRNLSDKAIRIIALLSIVILLLIGLWINEFYDEEKELLIVNIKAELIDKFENKDSCIDAVDINYERCIDTYLVERGSGKYKDYTISDKKGLFKCVTEENTYKPRMAYLAML